MTRTRPAWVVLLSCYSLSFLVSNLGITYSYCVKMQLLYYVVFCEKTKCCDGLLCVTEYKREHFLLNMSFTISNWNRQYPWKLICFPVVERSTCRCHNKTSTPWNNNVVNIPNNLPLVCDFILYAKEVQTKRKFFTPSITLIGW